MILLIDRCGGITKEEASLCFSLIPDHLKNISKVYCVLPRDRKQAAFQAASEKVWTKITDDTIAVFGSASKSFIPGWTPAPFSIYKVKKDNRELLVIALPGSFAVIPGWGVEVHYSARSICSFLTQVDKKKDKLISFKTIEDEESGATLENLGLNALPDLDISILTSPEELYTFLSQLDTSKSIGLDLETTGLHFYQDKILAASFVQGQKAGFFFWDEKMKDPFKQWLLEKKDLTIAGANLKFDFSFLAWQLFRDNLNKGVEIFTEINWQDIILRFIAEDTSRTRAKSLKYLSLRYLGLPDYTLLITEKTGSRAAVHKFFEEEAEKSEGWMLYNVLDSWIPLQLWDLAENLLHPDSKHIYDIFLERPAKLLFSLSVKGVNFDWDKTKEFADTLKGGLDSKSKLLEDKYEIKNPRSTKQILEKLLPFAKEEKISLDGLRVTPKLKKIAIDTANLEKLLARSAKGSTAEELIRTLYQYKSGFHLWTNFLKEESWKRFADDDGVIHPDYNQHQTSSGRLSSSKPNLQQVPALRVIFKANRLEFDEYDKVKNVRELFIPSKGLDFLGEVDGSQMEVRIFAFLFQDPALLRIFREKGDFYTSLASLIYNKKPEEVEKEERSLTKTATLGILYGMGLKRAIQVWKKPPDIVKRAYYKVHDTISSLSLLFNWGEQKVRANTSSIPVAKSPSRDRVLLALDGYSYDPFYFQRRVYIDLKESVINFPIQSFASDLMLIMARLAWQKFESKEFQMFNVVHDSFLFSIKDELREEFQKWSFSTLPKILSPGFGHEEGDMEFILSRVFKYFPSRDGFYEIPEIDIEIGWGKSWGDIEKSKDKKSGLFLPDKFKKSKSFIRFLPMRNLKNAVPFFEYMYLVDSRILVPKIVYDKLKGISSDSFWIGTYPLFSSNKGSNYEVF